MSGASTTDTLSATAPALETNQDDGMAADTHTNGSPFFLESNALAADMLTKFIGDPEFDYMIPSWILKNCIAVALYKCKHGGLLFGVEVGTGIVTSRVSDGKTWSPPAAFQIRSIDIGIQLGIESADALICILQEDALDSLFRNEAHIMPKGKLALTLGTLGMKGDIMQETSTHRGQSIYVFSDSKGLYTGMTMDGARVSPKDDENATYFEREHVAMRDILHNEVENAPPSWNERDDPFRKALSTYLPPLHRAGKEQDDVRLNYTKDRHFMEDIQLM